MTHAGASGRNVGPRPGLGDLARLPLRLQLGVEFGQEPEFFDMRLLRDAGGFEVRQVGDSGGSAGREPPFVNDARLLDGFLLAQLAGDAAGAQIGADGDTTGQARTFADELQVH
jgi:hypothetical protein